MSTMQADIAITEDAAEDAPEVAVAVGAEVLEVSHSRDVEVDNTALSMAIVHTIVQIVKLRALLTTKPPHSHT